MTETTIAITRATRSRLNELQEAMRAERGGRSVDADTALNRALDRSEQLARIALDHPELFHGQ